MLHCATLLHIKFKANVRACLSWWIDGIKSMWQHSVYRLFHHPSKRTQPSSVSFAPVFVSPDSDWWEFSSASREQKKKKAKERKEKKVCYNVHSLLSHTRWLNPSCAKRGEWKTGKLLQKLRFQSQGKGTACVKRFTEFQCAIHTHTQLQTSLSIAPVFVASERGYIWNLKCQIQWLNQ